MRRLMKPESRLNAKICPGTGNSRAGEKKIMGLMIVLELSD